MIETYKLLDRIENIQDSAYENNIGSNEEQLEVRTEIVKLIKELKLLNIDSVSERFLVEYKNYSGACRQKYIDAINKDDAWNKFKIANSSEITSITNIRQL